MDKDLHFDELGTLCVQSGWQPETGEARVLPIYQSTTFKYGTGKELGDLFDLQSSGHFYSRLANPTTDLVAQKIVELEGGVAGILTSSGQAASFMSIFNIANAGDHIVSINALYGGTYNLFKHTMGQMGIACTFLDPGASDEEIRGAFRPETKAVFAETLTNPSLRVLDIERWADLAHEHEVPLIVDNTFPTPILCRPFDFGADIVVHSTTKYMDGHATSVGGAIIDSGKFDWNKVPEKYPGLTTPDETYHGLTFTESFGKAAYVTKLTTTLMRDLGSTPAPASAFLLNLGLETLHLRMKAHSENALVVAKHLAEHEKVAWVSYPGLASDSEYELAQKYLPHGCSGVVGVGIKGGRQKAMEFMNNLQLASIVTHVADARTCVLHPASTTHRQMNDEELLLAGIRPETVRLSVGIESVNDILKDLDQALAKI